MSRPLGLSRRWLHLAAALVCGLASVLAGNVVRAERPTAAHLFPEDTVVYLRITDANDLAAKLKESSAGQVRQNETLKPLFSELYKVAEEAYAEIEDRVGLSLDQLLDLPQGEIAFGVSAPKNERPRLMLLIDTGERVTHARKLLDRLAEIAKDRGATEATDVYDSTKLTTYTGANNPDRHATYFIKDNTVVITTDIELSKHILEAWREGDVKTLADNSSFASIMQRCTGDAETPPLTSFFIDPINLTRAIGRNTSMAAFLAFIPATGLDGVKGIGGSAAMNVGDYETVQHLHILLDTPRTGIVDALALSSGDITPEDWVPPDAASYLTIHWDFQQTYLAVEKVYDSFTNEGALADTIKQNVDQPLEISFFEDILPVLNGRVTMVADIVDPPRWNSQASLIGVKLNDAAAFQKTLDKITAKAGDNLKKGAFGSVEYRYFEFGRDLPADAFPDYLRRPEPCFCILGDYFLYSDSVDVLKKAVLTKSDASRGLANEPDFKLIASRAKRQLDGTLPGMFAFGRPDKVLKLYYNLLGSPQTKELLTQQSKNLPWLGKIKQALENNPLPPFATIQQNFTPTGGVMTNDETGFHYMTFTLKRSSE